jgi:hypothetical protein
MSGEVVSRCSTQLTSLTSLTIKDCPNILPNESLAKIVKMSDKNFRLCLDQTLMVKMEKGLEHGSFWNNLTEVESVWLC